MVAKVIDDELDDSDPGDVTFLSYRYQAAITAITSLKLLSDEYSAVYAEHLDDLLVIREDGSRIAVQVKTRKARRHHLKANEDEVVNAIDRFYELEAGDSKDYSRFVFWTDHGFWDESRATSLVYLKELYERAPSELRDEEEDALQSFEGRLHGDLGKIVERDILREVFRKVLLKDESVRRDNARAVLQSKIDELVRQQYGTGIHVAAAARDLIELASLSMEYDETEKTDYFSTLHHPEEIRRRAVLERKRISEQDVRTVIENAGKVSDGSEAVFCVKHFSQRIVQSITPGEYPPLAERLEFNFEIDQIAFDDSKSEICSALKRQRQTFEELDKKRKQFPNARIAYYGIAHLPFVFDAGRHLGSSTRPELFELASHSGHWKWITEQGQGFPNLSTDVEPQMSEGEPHEVVDVAIRVSISALVREDQLPSEPVFDASAHLSIPDPQRFVVDSLEQVEQYRGQFEDVLKKITRAGGHRTRLHIFFAGPVSVAVAFARFINETMFGAAWIYNFDAGYNWRINIFASDVEEAVELLEP